ncbi:hypothetical protein ITJ50_06260 [Curtobacterium sp. VKM Ac-2889]|uniref:hypothetical protein n=1 Tax=unclassified Curtobacterium TaxID=257496 RepID=UPI00188D0400|nr:MULTISPECIES: hypothetical protein [unclassified Curtobacterium]MBF4599066.1 hypothetical protein [Curtobacterium sp. VKM Ac-1796]MBF4610819.1 hypothetical protein [Curtobacterium sp. VKM Ac-2889]UXZ58907.1 hypothetical protein MXD64_05920 [Curtobacterium sp. Arg-1]
MQSEWVPMGTAAADRESLHEGVPPWMATRFWIWIDAAVKHFARDSTNRLHFVAEYDELRRLVKPLAPEMRGSFLSTALQMRKDSDLTLSVADFLVAKLSFTSHEVWNEDLEELLANAGSAWRVGRRLGAAGLERRVPIAVQVASDAVMSSTGGAGELLSDAWHAAFGMNPDPDKAYSKAIKAVEEAAKPRVSPKDSVATLGKMVSAMRDQKDWALPLQDDEANPSSDTIVKMMRSLHSGQQQRHGGNGDRAATQEEAEAALFLAVPLVQFFHGGMVARRS